MAVFTEAQWSAIEPLIEAVRPQTGRELSNLRRTVEAILWRMQNGAKWRAIPAELGPWWMAAQTFLRWSKLGVWERLFEAAKAAARAASAPRPTRLRTRGAGLWGLPPRPGRPARRHKVSISWCFCRRFRAGSWRIGATRLIRFPAD